MVYDSTVGALLIERIQTAERTATLLRSSLRRLAGIMPIPHRELDLSDETTKEMLDAFRVRFCDLQDFLGTAVFRTILIFEEEKLGSSLDVLNQILKRRLIPSFDTWKAWRHIRNAFAHEYPTTEAERVDALNAAFQAAPGILAVLDAIKAYMLQNYPELYPT